MDRRKSIGAAKFQLHPAIIGENEEDTRLLREMAEEALLYVRGFKWAPPIESLHLAFGVGGLVALFLVTFGRAVQGNPDRQLWVVVGDLPPAYFVIDAAPDPKEALTAYCELMEEWAEHVLQGRDLSRCFPVEADPTAEHARMLKTRTEFIREKLIPIANDGPTA